LFFLSLLGDNYPSIDKFPVFQINPEVCKQVRLIEFYFLPKIRRIYGSLILRIGSLKLRIEPYFVKVRIILYDPYLTLYSKSCGK